MKHQKLQFKPGSFRLNGLFRVVFLMCCLLSAGLTQAQEKKITAEFKDVPLSNVLKQLEKLSTYKILFTYDDVQSYKVTVSLKDATITEALQKVLDGKPFVFSDVANGKYISVVYQPKKKSDTTKEIKGKVVDNKGETVIGATIRVVNATIGTATDIDGNFTLRVPEDVTTLEVGFVGMKTQLVSIKGKTEVNVVLEEDNTVLEDVVVTGIFKKAKESYTGAVSSISSEQLRMYKGQNLLQTLKNIDASLNFAVDNLNGSNPNRLPDVNIRGNASLPMNVEEFNEGNKNNPNTPLIIMDGFEISLTKLMDYNDEEIASINILKDAAATAIYGSRGANGVIVVLSKKPEPGKLKISAEAGMSLEVPDLSSYHLLNAAEKLEVEQRAGLYEVSSDNYGDYATLQQYYDRAYNKRLKRILGGVDTDWLSKPLHTGVGSKYALRLEGGSEEFRWSTSLSYNNVQGAMRGSSRRTFNGSVTLMYELKNLIFRNYTSVGINRSRESNYGSFSVYAAQQPYNAPYDEEGKLVRWFDPFHEGVTYDRAQNPLYDATLNTFDKTGYQELTNNFSIEWKVLEGLTVRGLFGLSSTQNTSDYFLPSEHSYFTTGDAKAEYATDEGFLRRGLYRYGNGKVFACNANLTLAYNKVFRDVHSLYAGLDWSMQQNKNDYFAIALEGFANEDLHSLGDARQYAKNELPSGGNSLQRQFGLTGNVNYTYDNRYYVDFSYRVDGNSSYGSNKKYAPFYSVGIGWNLHREKFMVGQEVLNTLRLKASYGETGSSTGASMTDAYTIYKYVTDNKYATWTGAQLSGWGNPDLTWQTTKQMNLGLEFGLWENRVKGSLDVYTKKTDNLLSSITIPSSMGFTAYNDNIGEVKNRGYEAMLSVYVMRDRERDINWMITGQLLYNKNKISRLSDAIKAQTEAFMQSDAASDVQKLFYEGDPQNAIYAVRSLGIDPSTGKEIFLDREGNITKDWKASDKVCMGSAEPLYRGNASTMFQWKNLTFNVSFYYYWGGKMYNQTLRDKVEVITSSLRSSNADARVLENRWYEVGDVAFFKKLSNNVTRSTSRYVMDDRVFEIQSVSLQYKWNSQKLKKWANLNTVIFGVNMSDLGHFSSIRMERGTDYPFARNIQASIKLLF